MKTKAIILFVGLATLALLATSANAQPVVEEQFDYDVVNLDTQSGGMGFDAAWSATVSHNTRFWAMSASGLQFSTLPVGGRSVTRGGNAGRGAAFRTISAASQSALTADGTTIWFSVLIEDESGNFLFGTDQYSTESAPVLGTGNTDQTADFVAIDGSGFGFRRRGAGTGISAHVHNGSSAVTASAGSFEPDPITGVVLIVGKINWKANGTPDEFFLFNVTDINTEPLEGAAFASITDQDIDQSTFDTVTIHDGLTSVFDEIRFGSTFADVTTLGTAGVVLPDATVIPTKANYSVGESIVIDYANGTGSASNMIGINIIGQNGPFWDPGLWLLIGGAQTEGGSDVDGQVSFGAGSDGTAAWPLPVGEYVALFFTDDTRTIVLATSDPFNVALVGDPDPPNPSITPSSGFPVADETFSLTAPTGGTGYQWAFEGGDISDGGSISGATTNVLLFDTVQEIDTGLYEVSYDDGPKAPVNLSYFMSVLPSGTILPLTGLLGLGLLASACAMGGASVLRRKK